MTTKEEIKQMLSSLSEDQLAKVRNLIMGMISDNAERGGAHEAQKEV